MFREIDGTYIILDLSIRTNTYRRYKVCVVNSLQSSRFIIKRADNVHPPKAILRIYIEVNYENIYAENFGIMKVSYS